MFRFGRPALLLVAVLVLACETPSEPPMGSPVQVSLDGRAFVEELVIDASQAAGWSVHASAPGSPPHLGFGGWLLGRAEQFLATASIAETRSGEYEPFCSGDSRVPEDGFWSTRDSCMRLRVNDGVYAMDVYFTERPHRLPDDRHPLRYPSDLPASGQMAYADNPLFVWTFVQPSEGSMEIRVEFDASVRQEQNAGSILDISHSGFVEVQLEPSGSQGRFQLSIELFGLTDCVVPLSVSVSGRGSAAEGAVLCGEFEVAAIGHVNDEFVFTWN